MDITLKSERLQISKILRKTKAKMLCDLKVGDIITLSIPVVRAGMNKGTYASYIEIENLENKECSYKSFNEIGILLNCFEFVIS